MEETANETVLRLPREGYHLAITGAAKIGKSSLAFSAMDMLGPREKATIVDSDGGTMTALGDYDAGMFTHLPATGGIGELTRQLERASTRLIIVDDVLASLDAGKALARKQKPNAKNGPRDWARIAAEPLPQLFEAIRNKIVVQKAIVISVCGIEEHWVGFGDQRQCVGWRPGLSYAKAEKYFKSADAMWGVTLTPGGEHGDDYENMVHVAYTRRCPEWPDYASTRGGKGFEKKIPMRWVNPSIPEFFRRWAQHIA